MGITGNISDSLISQRYSGLISGTEQEAEEKNWSNYLKRLICELAAPGLHPKLLRIDFF